MAQLFLDAFLSNDFSGIVGNLVKLGLGVLAMGFDVLFMIQHYVLYREKGKEPENESEPILPRVGEC